MRFFHHIFFAIIAGVLMGPSSLFAKPHEPSPAGGGWLELNRNIRPVESGTSWFPEALEPLTLEAWVYIEEPPSIQNAFSIVGQTNRFTWTILGTHRDSNSDGVRDSIGDILAMSANDSCGMVTAHLPAKQWVHYVAIIDRGVALGSNGRITGKSLGEPLVFANNKLVIGGSPLLTETGFPKDQRTLQATGVYIDELRISQGLRYAPGHQYTLPMRSFTPDARTLGLYHFDEELTTHYEDASEHQMTLIRRGINAASHSDDNDTQP